MRDRIGADIVAWLASDPETASHWRALASALNLDIYIKSIENEGNYAKRFKSDQQKLQELMEVWQRASPITFTRQRLMEALNKEGLHHMRQWLEIIDTENSSRKSEIAEILDRSRARSSLRSTPSPTQSTSSSSSFTTNNYKAIKGDLGAKIPPRSTGGILKLRNEKSNDECDEETRSERSSSTSTKEDHGILIYHSSPRSGARRKHTSGLKSIRFALDEPSLARSEKHFEPMHVVTRKKEILTKDELDDSSDSGVASTDRPLNNASSAIQDADNRRVNVDKYFDNLISLIQEAADGIATT